MTSQASEKLRIFLLLALRRSARRAEFSDDENLGAENSFTALAEQLSAPELEEFRRLHSDYREKSEEGKQQWRARVEKSIGADEPFVDENIHLSHIEAALLKETPAIRKIIEAHSPHRDDSHRNAVEVENSEFQPNERLVKKVRRAFARQFVALRDLPAQTAFDRSSGAQFARLVRLAGVGEVALACVRITAVESVAAFLRRFPPEDARAIAVRLKDLPPASEERLAFAERLVQSALEIELKPAPMLDLLGIRLVGILLCGGAPERLAYTQQKLPLEVARNLSEIVENECRQTPTALQREIGLEIERLAETVAKTSPKI